MSLLPGSSSDLHAPSLLPAAPDLAPGAKYRAKPRPFQGIPAVERTAGGRLFAAWYTGGDDEGPGNFVLLVRSDDDGQSWSPPLLAVDPPGAVRAFDAALWIDPSGRLWLFWSQSHEKYNGRAGVFFVRCDEPDAAELRWTAPARLSNGIMMNKPLVRSNGEWLFPVALWNTTEPRLPELAEERFSNVLVSADRGATFSLRGRADVPLRSFDEHMLVERPNGDLWMLVRTSYGIGQSLSADGGQTWSPGAPTDIPGPDSRFFLRRLPSGRLLLVNHHRFTRRSHLTALLSDDEGKTWPHRLLLDGRPDVSYPDAAISPDGRIHVIYDRERHQAREILLASVTEAEILDGSLHSPASFLARIVDRAAA